MLDALRETVASARASPDRLARDSSPTGDTAGDHPQSDLKTTLDVASGARVRGVVAVVFLDHGILVPVAP